jgi:mRNA interferase RelE/StbE
VSYRLLLLPRAEKQLAKLPQEPYRRVRDGIRSLAEEPRPSGCRKLKGRDGYRLRIGSYRVIYRIDDPARDLTNLDVAHRRDVYR